MFILIITLGFTYDERETRSNIKKSKNIWPSLFGKLSFAFYIVVTASVVTAKHLLAGIYFIVLMK